MLSISVRNQDQLCIGVHPLSRVAELMRITDTIKTIVPSAATAVCEIGRIVAAQFDVDQQWYRALIVNRRSTTRCRVSRRPDFIIRHPLQVYFLDFGNEADVSVSQLRTLPADFCELKPCAIHVSIDVHMPFDAANANEFIYQRYMVARFGLYKCRISDEF